MCDACVRLRVYAQRGCAFDVCAFAISISLCVIVPLPREEQGQRSSQMTRRAAEAAAHQEGLALECPLHCPAEIL